MIYMQKRFGLITLSIRDDPVLNLGSLVSWIARMTLYLSLYDAESTTIYCFPALTDDECFAPSTEYHLSQSKNGLN